MEKPFKKDEDNVAEQDIELTEWLESLQAVMEQDGNARAQFLLEQLQSLASRHGITNNQINTPYVNTIPPEEQPQYPGDLTIEQKISNLIRWNAMAMVVRANKKENGIGGHISTYASSAILYDIAFNHFFRGKGSENPDFVYFQGHGSPGVYARAYLEGRISETQLENFRRESAKDGGLSSYPHPQLMPKFWEFPTVSMGIGGLTALYHARFIRYLENRGLKSPSTSKVWCFLGDGEMDEPESVGAISLASREKLDNLIFVVNCNLQRLDGPVRGNGKVIQELEGIFKGAGWNVIKVVWGSEWDELLAKDVHGKLVERLGKLVDGQFQKFIVSDGAFIRAELTKDDPDLAELFSDLSDEDIKKLSRGGHDPFKVYAAFDRAVNHQGAPTVILTKTVKGFGMGDSGEGKNVAHQQKKLGAEDIRAFRDRFQVSVSDADLEKVPFVHPGKDSAEVKYMLRQRETLGGAFPERLEKPFVFEVPASSAFEEFYPGTGTREVSTTMAVVKVLSNLLKDKNIAKYLVPIIPDEARTFGMESFFRQIGIYSPVGQLYDPVDSQSLLYYKESKSGQVLEEGITEAGSISSFIAAGTAYANHGIPMIPFYIFYSMFGLQRIGDFAWAASDQKCKGFLIGATAGRTTLAGEGLQHQDGHSHVLAYPVPTLKAYDPAFAYEIAVILEDGIKRMYKDNEDAFYYVTVGNENYVQPAMPEGCREGIIKGLYLFKKSTLGKKVEAQLFGSGAILNEVLKAQEILEKDYGIASQVWSVTSYKELWKNALDIERWNVLHPLEKQKTPYLSEVLAQEEGVYVAASDYSKMLSDSISKWFPKRLYSLGTDGFGFSEGRKELREHFEVDDKSIVFATLSALHREGKIKAEIVEKAKKKLEINTEKRNPYGRLV